jgi:formyltetrahydrofolate synthetase
LATAVTKACAANDENHYEFLYELDLSIKETVQAISKAISMDIYGADGVDYSDVAN